MNVKIFGLVTSQFFESCKAKILTPVIFDKMEFPIITAIMNSPKAIPKNNNNCIHAGFVLRYVCIASPFLCAKFAVLLKTYQIVIT